VSTLINLKKVSPSGELMQQVHNTREILLTPAKKILSKINEHKENNDMNIIYLPVRLEAHIIALIKGGLS
jgi:hypothetical protein